MHAILPTRNHHFRNPQKGSEETIGSTQSPHTPAPFKRYVNKNFLHSCACFPSSKIRQPPRACVYVCVRGKERGPGPRRTPGSLPPPSPHGWGKGEDAPRGAKEASHPRRPSPPPSSPTPQSPSIGGNGGASKKDPPCLVNHQQAIDHTRMTEESLPDSRVRTTLLKKSKTLPFQPRKPTIRFFKVVRQCESSCTHVSSCG
jgi:hypothetical protein